MNRSVSGMLAIVVVGAGWPAAARSQFTPAAEDAVNDCGVNALYVMLRLEGRAADLADLRRTLPDRREDGLSMADLQDAAAAWGCRLVGRQVGPERLPLDRPAIAWQRHEGSGHFIVLRPVGETGTMVAVLDFPRPPRVVDYTELLESPRWSGRVLMPDDPWRHAAKLGVGCLALAAVAGLSMLRRRLRSATPPL